MLALLAAEPCLHKRAMLSIARRTRPRVTAGRAMHGAQPVRSLCADRPTTPPLDMGTPPSFHSAQPRDRLGWSWRLMSMAHQIRHWRAVVAHTALATELLDTATPRPSGDMPRPTPSLACSARRPFHSPHASRTPTSPPTTRMIPRVVVKSSSRLSLQREIAITCNQVQSPPRLSLQRAA